MIYDKKTAFKTASSLLQINAIKLNPKNPFVWASGWRSPIYCDNRIALSFPKVRQFLSETLASHVKKIYGTEKITIAGVATGAIGIGILVAQQLDLPFVYVRPEPKKHGAKNQIEGTVPEGHSVVVIEDLISTGMSSLKAIKAIREAEIPVLGILALFSYGFDVAKKSFEEENVTLHTLSDYEHLITHAVEVKEISSEHQSILQEWRENPSIWEGIG